MGIALSRLSCRAVRRIALGILLGCLMPLAASAGDIPGSRDHPLVGRYAGSQIIIYEHSRFDRVDLIASALPKDVAYTNPIPAANRLRVEGKSYHIVYEAPADRSVLEIDANLAANLQKEGFAPVFACEDRDCLSGGDALYNFGALADAPRRNAEYATKLAYRLEKLARPQGDVYVAMIVGKSGGAPVVSVRVVEVAAMQQGQVVFLAAPKMKAGIDVAGHVALYGIRFDFDKAALRPESAPTLAEIAKLMAADPGLRLVVAGHTDNQGGFGYNLSLSSRRAAAVVDALVHRYHIDPSRLTPFGAGMAAPIASNADEAGRAKNRRVELVKR